MYFSKFLILFFMFSYTLVAYTMSPVDSLFSQANRDFQSENYEQALHKYQSLLEQNIVSEMLYYNLGNTYFKLNQKGKSILYFEKSLKLNPQNKNTLHNLNLVKNSLENPLNLLPDLFFVAWWKSFIQLFTSNTWAWISLTFSWFAFIAFIFYLYSKKLSIRKKSFYKLLLFGTIFLFCLFISAIQSQHIFKRSKIVLISNQTTSKVAPSLKSKDAFIFYEGAQFILLDQVDNLFKIKAPEGDFVWVKKEDFELI